MNYDAHEDQTITSADEIRRVDEGPRLDEQPRGIGTIAIVGLCKQDASLVALRCREVLRVVLQDDFDPSASTEDHKSRVPQWFIETCAPEKSEEELAAWLEEWRTMTPEQKAAADRAQRWSLADWLYWFTPSERPWKFWECIADRGVVRLHVQIDEWPIAHGALDWLLRAAGASDVVIDDGT